MNAVDHLICGGPIHYQRSNWIHIRDTEGPGGNIPMEEGEQVRIVVKCGVLMSVLIPRQRYRELRVAVSDTVALHINSEKIQII